MYHTNIGPKLISLLLVQITIKWLWKIVSRLIILPLAKSPCILCLPTSLHFLRWRMLTIQNAYLLMRITTIQNVRNLWRMTYIFPNAKIINMNNNYYKISTNHSTCTANQLVLVPTKMKHLNPEELGPSFTWLNIFKTSYRRMDWVVQAPIKIGWTKQERS